MSFAEWHRTRVPIDDEPEDEGESFGAELLDSDMAYSHAGADAFADYVGDVGRDPFGGAWQMNVND